MTRDDTGSGTVLVLGLSAVLLLVSLVFASVAAVAVARHRAASAADLAALAAADRALSGPSVACAAARRAAGRAGASVSLCLLTGDVARVVAVVRPGGPIGRLGSASATARAGPRLAR